MSRERSRDDARSAIAVQAAMIPLVALAVAVQAVTVLPLLALMPLVFE